MAQNRFSVATCLQVVTFAAIAMAGIATGIKLAFPVLKYDVTVSLFWSMDRLRFAGPFFVPLIFGAYAVGRRDMNWRILLAFAVAECAAAALASDAP